MIAVTFYLIPDNEECIAVERALRSLQTEISFQLICIDITTDPALQKVYDDSAPVVKAGPYHLERKITEKELRIAILAASDRKNQFEKLDDPRYIQRTRRGRVFSRLDSFSYWVSHHYLALFNSFLFIYVAVAFLPAILMKIGGAAPAQILYTAYSPLCHQLAFRSWFLFGEQPYYPRSLAGIAGVKDFESVAFPGQVIDETSGEFINTARLFTGDEKVGFKVALCQRDLAIYGGMFLYGFAFAVSGRKFRQVPWYLWLLLGVIPIGIDGLSQFPSLIGNLPAWLPIRESTPLIRTLTGLLFGSLTAGYLYPLIEEMMQETRAFLSSKKQVISQAQFE